MRRQVLGYVLAILAIVAVVAIAAPALFDSASVGREDSARVSPTDAPADAPEPVVALAARPDCPGEEIAGVELGCLGEAESGEGEASADSPAVINLWAWWCAPCREELPLFDELAQRRPDLVVAGVHADEHAGNGAALLEELGVGLASFQDDDNAFAAALELPRVVPITVVVAGGEPAAVYPRTFSTVEELERAVDEALADAPAAG